MVLPRPGDDLGWLLMMNALLLWGGLVSPDTIGICGVHSEVEAEVVSDESGDAGVEAWRSE
jgi:hypothetical protein